MQKESLLFFSFPRRSNFSKAKVTKKREQYKISSLFFLCRVHCKLYKVTNNLIKRERKNCFYLHTFKICFRESHGHQYFSKLSINL